MKKFSVRFLATLAILYCLALAALFSLQRSVLYIPPSIYLTPTGVNLNGAIEVTHPEHPNSLLGWWMPPKKDDAPVVLFFHGNGSAVYSNYDIYSALHMKGIGVFALAYPGYPGGPSLKTTQDSLTAAAIEGYDYVARQGIDADKIVFYGTSLGAGIAAQLTQHRRPSIIIMEAPFTSAADMAQLRFPIFPAAALTKDKFKSDKALARSDIPLLWLHGTHDRVIPFHIGETLFEAYGGPKAAYKFDGGQHTNIWYVGGREIIMDRLAALRRPAD